MPRNGSGTMTIPNSLVPATPIASAPLNANFSDIGTELTNSLPRDGQAGMTGQLKAADGSAAAPGVSFTGDTNTGLRRPGTDAVAVVTGGVDRLTVDTSAVTAALPVKAADGSAAAPAVTFATDADTGLFREAENTLAVAAGGVKRVAVDTANAKFSVAVRPPAGTPAAPGLAFAEDDSGFYWQSDGLFYAVTNAGARIAFADAGVYPATNGLLQSGGAANRWSKTWTVDLDASGTASVANLNVTVNATGKGVARCYGLVAAAGTLTYGHRVASVVRNGVGDYTVNFTDTITNPVVLATVYWGTTDQNPAAIKVKAVTGTSAQIVIWVVVDGSSPADTDPVDRNFFFQVLSV